MAPIGMARLAADADARNPGQGLDEPYDGDRAEDAAMTIEAGNEIDDADLAAIVVAEDRFEHRGIADVALAAARKADHFDLEDPIGFEPGIAQEIAEDGIAIEAGNAAPLDPRALIDQRGDGAIAEQFECLCQQRECFDFYWY